MARKTPSRRELRKQHEAAESRDAGSDEGKATKRKKKKSAAADGKKPASRKRKKDKVQQRKRLVWVVYSASMKEEGRFSYDQRDDADKKAEQLHKKAGKTFFVQPLKEPIAETPEDKETKTAKAAKKKAADKKEEKAGEAAGK